MKSIRMIFNDYYISKNYQIIRWETSKDLWYSIYLLKCIWVSVFSIKLIKFLDWLLPNQAKKNDRIKIYKKNGKIRLQYCEIIKPERFGEDEVSTDWKDVPLWDSEKQELKPNFTIKEQK